MNASADEIFCDGAGAKAAADPTRRAVMAVVNCIVEVAVIVVISFATFWEIVRDEEEIVRFSNRFDKDL